MPSCGVCGCSQFEMIDGLSFCSQCHTINRNVLETEREVEGADLTSIGLMRASKIKTKTVVRDSLLDHQSTEAKRIFELLGGTEQNDQDQLMEDDEQQPNGAEAVRDQPSRELNPSFMCEYQPDLSLFKLLGVRLTTFAKILGRFVAFLVRTRKAPQETIDVAFAIWTRYLREQGVAFFDGEATQAEKEMFRAVVLLGDEEKEAADQAKLARKERAKEKIFEATDEMWSMLLDRSMNERLEMEIESDDEAVEDGNEQEEDGEQSASGKSATKREKVKEPVVKSQGLVKMAQTFTSLDAVTRAGLVRLDVEVLCGIAQAALVALGYDVISLSDMIRWLREGRFFMSKWQLGVLSYRYFLYDDGSMAKASYNFKSGRTGQFWSFNVYLRELQFTFDSIVHLTRLPLRRQSGVIRLDQLVARHLHHFNLPRSLLPPAILLLSRLDALEVDLSAEACDQRYLLHSMWNSKEKNEKPKLFAPLGDRSSIIPFFHLSLDTKACAVILLLLRLSCDIDSANLMISLENIRNGNVLFDVSEWLWQMRMRTRLWDGDELEEVAAEVDRGDSSFADIRSPVVGDDEDAFMRTKNYSVVSDHSSRFTGFSGGWTPLPKRTNTEPMFSRLHPFPEDITHTRISQTEMAAIYPLHFHAKDGAERFESKLTSAGLQHCLPYRILRKSFQEAKMSVLADGRCEEVEEEMDQEWSKLFPLAHSYHRLPRPELAAEGCLYFYSECTGFSFLPGLRLLGASSSDSALAWRVAAASRALSRPFSFALHAISRCICEETATLFGALLLLEYRLFDANKCKKLQRRLDEGEEIPVTLWKAGNTGGNSITGGVRRPKSTSGIPDGALLIKGLRKQRTPHFISKVGEKAAFEEDILDEESEGEIGGEDEAGRDQENEEEEGTAEEEEQEEEDLSEAKTRRRIESVTARLHVYIDRRNLLDFDFVWRLAASRLW